MRRGAWDIDARIADMDIDGVYASVNFPSALLGFAGQRLQRETDDPELALALIRANNDWHKEVWADAYPDRIIACQVPYLLDPEIGAAEVRHNAARGFKAVTFPEAPEKLGLPSLHTGYWDPFMQACEETETVICLHIGSASSLPSTSSDAPADAIGVLAFAFAMFSAVDWLYSMIPVRFPGIKIAMSEGGIGWVPGLLDRLDHVLSYHDIYGTWHDQPLTPGRGLPAQLLALRARRSVGLSAAPPDRHRPDPDGGGLPASGFQLAAHPADAGRAGRRLPGGRGPPIHLGERVQALPPPGAGRRRPLPRSLLTK